MLECQTWKGSTIHENNLLEKCIKELDPKRKEKGKLNNGWVCMYVCMCVWDPNDVFDSWENQWKCKKKIDTSR